MVLFSASAVLLFADQNLMAPNLTAMAREFHFTDEERDQKLGGDLAVAFFLLGAPASYAIGCLADTYDRSLLFATTVGLGELACLATYFVQSYRQLYITRALTGVALGAALPLIYSVSGDLFPARQRHVASALVGLGTGWGVALGQTVAGFIGPQWGWRLPFLIISIPALICALLVLFTVQDPPRGKMEQAVLEWNAKQTIHDSSSPVGVGTTDLISHPQLAALDNATDYQKSDENNKKNKPWKAWPTFVSLISTPTVMLAMIQGAPGCVPWGIIHTYLNDYLSQDRGMSIQKATLVFVMFGLGKTLGLLVGGLGGSTLYLANCRYPALLAGSAAILGCFPFWLLLNHVDNTSPLLWVFFVAFLFGSLCTITGPIVKATLQNVCLPQARGQAFALFNLFDDLGKGLGPALVAFWIVQLGGRKPAFNMALLCWLLCGILNLLIFFTVAKDETRVHMAISRSMELTPIPLALDPKSTSYPGTFL